MCGRINGSTDGNFIWEVTYPDPWTFSGELRPSDPYPIIRKRPGTDELEALSARWGLIPSFCKGEEDLKKFKHTFNARSETAHTLPSFRKPFQSQRCLIEISGFYEFELVGKRKMPVLFSSATGGPLILAGLWDYWQSREGLVHSFTILTCTPCPAVAPFHDRMPCVLGRQGAEHWLQNRSISQLQTLLKPCPASWLSVTRSEQRLAVV
ncbi:SOS response-associated peptidase [Deinococcus cellulosilyticus]|uniref:Abasic site processing protein n=1 Tax=Deinococcus cellulosilyticus (strain DSM 18568 / NBRC 106333 / KACC 11606 / 5516J-15) TaxID=1223518 RepID=A0A511NAD6_DEIC1|nr:SOS response-associated peptidase [Deinococcus cellulosilyticus]GEM49789.1 DUF159 family protein [Deinococcus cellulosilyticus NBRC 106333 = KACC 11606]